MDEIEKSAAAQIGPDEPDNRDDSPAQAPAEMSAAAALDADAGQPGPVGAADCPDPEQAAAGAGGPDGGEGLSAAGLEPGKGGGKAARLEQQFLEQQLAGLGLNAADLFSLLLGSPLLRQTTALAEEALAARAEKQRAEALRGIAALAPDLGRPEQLAAAPEYPEMQRILRRHKGMSELDAFKLAFFDRLTRQQAEAGRQGAINAARGRQHLAGVGGQPAGADELTDEEIREYRRYNPSWTVAQIRRFHREYLETAGG